MDIDAFFVDERPASQTNGVIDPEEITTLKVLDDRYYNAGEPDVSDKEYDEMKEKIRKKYPEHPYFQEVGSSVKGRKVELPFVLGSLNKIKQENAAKWFQGRKGPWIITEKLDGVSILIKYSQGRVVQAMTRGNGIQGKDITSKAKIFCPEIDSTHNLCKYDLWLRGEVVMNTAEAIELGFQNGRNGAAGILNRDDNKNVNYLYPVFYEIVDADSTIMNLNEADKFIELDGTNFDFPKIVTMKENPEPEYLVGLLSSWKLDAVENEREIDGLVIKPLEYERENIPYPENMVAFKMNAEPVKTIVYGLEWNVSRKGKLKPVVQVKPTRIGGVTVRKTTGFNAKFIKDNKIGHDAEILLVRSGDVIPHIVEVLKPGKPEKLEEFEGGYVPNRCPSCYEKVEWNGVDLVCGNMNCKQSDEKRIAYFLRTLGAENITEKTIQKLGLDDIRDCYDLIDFEISEIAGFGINKGRQIEKEIDKTLETTEELLIAAFGFNGVSVTTAKKLIEHFGDIEKFISADLPDLMKVEGIGPVTAQAIFWELDNFYNLYGYLRGKGLTFINKSDNKLSGMIFTLTGPCPHMNRNNLIRMISNKGGLVKGISKKTNYLVVADRDTQSTKAKKARNYGIPIIDYDELMDMMEVY